MCDDNKRIKSRAPRRCFDCVISDSVSHKKFGWFLESIIRRRKILLSQEKYLYDEDKPLTVETKAKLRGLLEFIDTISQQMPLDGVWKTTTMQSLDSSSL